MNQKELEFELTLLNLLWRVSVPMILFIVLGYITDHLLDTGKLFLVLGIAAALATTFWGLYATYKKGIC